MARISTYALDTSLSKTDKLLGTDSSGDTRNYTLSAMSEYLGSAGVTGNLTFKFVNNTFGGDSTQANGQMHNASIGSSTQMLFSNVSSLILSEFPYEKDGSSLQRLQTLLNQKIIISRVDNPNEFGIYKVTSITNVSGTTLHTFALTHDSSNGNIIHNKYYNFNLLPEGGDKTKELEFNSNTFSKTGGSLNFETINGSNMCYIDFTHNLDKKASISVEQEGSPGQLAMMPVKYINNNTVRVYFTGTTSGKVYAN